jgi:molybdate transport system substrate-binding protein
MKPISRRVAASLSVLALALSAGARAQAAELQVLAGGAMLDALQVLAPQFEQASGHRLVIRYGTTPELIRLAASGSPFDLGVFPQDVLRDAATRAKFAPAPATPIARAGLAVAVRAGAPKPDISTPEALKQTLLRARSIATIPASATGTQLLRVFDTLGISEAMQSRIRAQPTPAQIVATVASGENELALFLMNVVTAPGLDVVGPFPAALQQEVVFTAAVALNTGQADAAAAFIRYLTSPAGMAVLKARGLNPG